MMIFEKIIPKGARPHETAILLLWIQGRDTKEIAYMLHYAKPQPVRRVIRTWENDQNLLQEREKSLELIKRLQITRNLALI